MMHTKQSKRKDNSKSHSRNASVARGNKKIWKPTDNAPALPELADVKPKSEITKITDAQEEKVSQSIDNTIKFTEKNMTQSQDTLEGFLTSNKSLSQIGNLTQSAYNKMSVKTKMKIMGQSNPETKLNNRKGSPRRMGSPKSTRPKTAHAFNKAQPSEATLKIMH